MGWHLPQKTVPFSRAFLPGLHACAAAGTRPPPSLLSGTPSPCRRHWLAAIPKGGPRLRRSSLLPWSGLCPIGEASPLFLIPVLHLCYVESPCPFLHQGDGWVRRTQKKRQRGDTAGLLLLFCRFSQLQSLTLIHWKSQVHAVLKVSTCGFLCMSAVTFRGCPLCPGTRSGPTGPNPILWGYLPGSPFLLSPPSGRR